MHLSIKAISDDDPLVDYRRTEPINRPEGLATATFTTTDLAHMRDYLESFLGL